MADALGMIETKGFVAMVEAADAMVKAACTPHLDPTDYKSFRQNLDVLRAGPGRLIAWEDTLTEEQKLGLKRAQEAQQRTLEKLERHGKLAAGGGGTDQTAAGRLKKRFGRVPKPGG